MNMQAENRAEYLAEYIFQKIGEKTPRDSDRLIKFSCHEENKV